MAVLKYEYIVPKSNHAELPYEMEQFIERSNEEQAVELIINRTKWNGGFRFQIRL